MDPQVGCCSHPHALPWQLLDAGWRLWYRGPVLVFLLLIYLMSPQRTSFVARSASPASSKLRAFTFGQQSVHAASKQPVASQDQGSAFGERMRRSSTHSHTRSVGKGKTSIESVDSRSSVVFSQCYCYTKHRHILILFVNQMILSPSPSLIGLSQKLIRLDHHLVLRSLRTCV